MNNDPDTDYYIKYDGVAKRYFPKKRHPEPGWPAYKIGCDICGYLTEGEAREAIRAYRQDSKIIPL